MEKALSNRAFYVEKMNLVKEYIHNHLDEKIAIEVLAEISCFSPFHFHRISKALLGEPIGKYIIRIRLEAASKMIRYSNLSLKDIAYSIGFETPSSLSKAFKNYFGISPSAYRKDKLYHIKPEKKMTEKLNIKKPKIVTLEDKDCIYYRLTGAYQNLDYAGAWTRLWQEVKTQQLFTAGMEHIGLPYDDPNVTDPDKIRYDACLVIHKDAKPSAEVGVKQLKGGEFVSFLYQGPYTNLSLVYDYIYNDWLLNNDYELRDELGRELYKNNPDRTEESKLKTEIFIPIQ
jgi:AraC family transcriptional regulator